MEVGTKDLNLQHFISRERAIIQTQIFDKLAMAANSSAAVGSISSFCALSPSPSSSSSSVAAGFPIPRRCPYGYPALQSSFVCRTTHSSFFCGGDAAAALASAHEGGNGHASGALGSQMNIFERAVRVVKSYANALISSAEDPEKLLDQTVLEMNEDLTKLRQASAQVLASQRQLENKYKAAQQTADDWYRRAKLALEKGEENLAREALKRRKDYEDSAKALKNQLDQQTSVVEKLISNTRLLESKIQEAKSKKDTLKARAQSAKTSQKVNEMLGNIKTSSALAAFDKMEEKVNALEAEADALNQLSTDDLAGKFALLESGGSVDDDLAALKKEMVGSSKKAGELPPGRTPASNVAYPFQDLEVERELNELRRKTMGS